MPSERKRNNWGRHKIISEADTREARFNAAKSGLRSENP